MRRLRANCAEGALQIIDGKARVIAEIIATDWARASDIAPGRVEGHREGSRGVRRAAVEELLKQQTKKEVPAPVQTGCPGSRLHTFASHARRQQTGQP